MKIMIAIIIFNILSLPLYADELSDDYQAGIIDGKAAATNNYNPDSWFAAGLGGGLVLHAVGAGVVIGLGQNKQVNVPGSTINRIDGKNQRYRDGFLEGYNNKVRKKRLISSIAGGLIGSILITSILVYQNNH